MIDRTSLALAAGALAGLLMAGAQLFTAPGALDRRALGAERVARVNGRPVLHSDYLKQLQTLVGKPPEQTTPDERRQVLEDMVREELFVQRGLEMDFPATDAEVRAALVRAVEQQATAAVQFAAPDEATLRQLHAAQGDRFTSPGTMALRAFVRPVPPQPEARHAATLQAATLLASADPARALQAAGWLPEPALSSEPALYLALHRQLGERLFDEARLLPEGAWSQAVTDEAGRLVVLQVLQHRPPRPRPYEEVRADVLQAWTRDAAAARLKETEAFLRSRADIQTRAPEALP